jgi:hypothetical protein
MNRTRVVLACLVMSVHGAQAGASTVAAGGGAVSA